MTIMDLEVVDTEILRWKSEWKKWRQMENKKKKVKIPTTTMSESEREKQVGKAAKDKTQLWTTMKRKAPRKTWGISFVGTRDFPTFLPAKEKKEKKKADPICKPSEKEKSGEKDRRRSYWEEAEDAGAGVCVQLWCSPTLFLSPSFSFSLGKSTTLFPLTAARRIRTDQWTKPRKFFFLKKLIWFIIIFFKTWNCRIS